MNDRVTLLARLPGDRRLTAIGTIGRSGVDRWLRILSRATGGRLVQARYDRDGPTRPRLRSRPRRPAQSEPSWYVTGRPPP